jgi:3-hydroxyisobutyrate dehydrogenase
MIVGFIGLGEMGRGIALMIERAGFPLHVWARREETLAPFRPTKAVVARSPREIGAQCDLVGICVYGDDDVREVLIDGGVIDGMAGGGIIAIHSTVHPDTCREIGALAARKHVQVLDAPVTLGGGSDVQRRGVMVGGDPDAFRAALPVLQSFGDEITLVGPIGTGQVVKVLSKTLFDGTVKLAADTLEVGELLGLDRATLVDVLQGSTAQSRALGFAARALAAPPPPQFAALRKDHEIFKSVIATAGIDASTLVDLADQGIRAVTEGWADPTGPDADGSESVRAEEVEPSL